MSKLKAVYPLCPVFANQLAVKPNFRAVVHRFKLNSHGSFGPFRGGIENPSRTTQRPDTRPCRARPARCEGQPPGFGRGAVMQPLEPLLALTTVFRVQSKRPAIERDDNRCDFGGSFRKTELRAAGLPEASRQALPRRSWPALRILAWVACSWIMPQRSGSGYMGMMRW